MLTTAELCEFTNRNSRYLLDFKIIVMVILFLFFEMLRKARKKSKNVVQMI